VIEDRFHASLAVGAPPALRAFNDAGVLSAADVHVAARLARLAGEQDPDVVLAAALAVRAPRLGHVYIDLATASETAVVESEEPVDLGDLPWPAAEGWATRLRSSPLTEGPLRLDGTRLYLDRYWREERQTAHDLLGFAGDRAIDEARLAGGLDRLFAPGDGLQRRAAASALRRRLAVVAGGPGTGKTTTVARIVALLAEQPGPAPLVALAAPTGKAAARLEESVHEEARKLDVAPEVRELLLGLYATTLHRLLGRRAGSNSRFRHDRSNRLPHDAIVVDETSMVSLSLMARLVEAVRPESRLVLVGDPGQLSSIEAGAVLGDIVGPATGDGIVVLERVHRFGGGIAALATAVRAGDADAALGVLAQAPPGVTWLQEHDLEPVRRQAVAAGRALIEAGRAGDAPRALHALGAFRVLCAHRHGPAGVAVWTAAIEGRLADAVPGFSPEPRWYPGRPLLVTENDYGLQLFNGDAGVVVQADDGRAAAAFERRGEVALFSPGRLEAVETVFAMTVHKSQGSQFGTAAVLLPAPGSRLLTRELLYTAVTRARERLILAGSEEAIRAAVARPIARASGLRRLLWSD
jgi:exodeoxyribonuclease V alpha subunit